MPIRSYVRSTDCHRKPCGEYVLCGVDIPVMVSFTLRAIPFPNIQRQLFNNVTKIATSLRTRKPSVNLDQSATIPITLVFKLSDQFAPTSIANGKGKFPILHHVLHSQILNGDGLVFTHQSSRQLVKEILSSVANFSMDFSDYKTGFITIARSLLLPAQRFLRPSQLGTFCLSYPSLPWKCRVSREVPMTKSSWLISWSVVSFLTINVGQLPAVATQHLVNQKIAPTKFLITINRPVLKLGSQGVNVSELQAALKLLGYFVGHVNGFYGESTASAVSKFQQASGLNADGIAGTETWDRLFPSVPTADRQESTVVNSRQNSSTNSASGFPVPSSLQRTVNRRDSRIIVTPPPAPVNRPNPIVPTTTTVSTTLNAQTDVVSLPILKWGMRGPAIMQLQGRLRTLGFFSNSIDGVFGDATQLAVKAAQQKFNLEPDGVVGAATWNALLR
jgi:peptidoglycan hydrolase-like protein with peptidoglycan-binding domain